MKNYIPIVILVILISGIIASYVFVVNNITEKDRLINQQQSKIEQLKQENASLHDDVWVLNQELMKGCME